jgi:MFS family permease
MTDTAAETVAAAADDEPQTAQVANVSPLYRQYVMWLLLLVYIVNFLDRQIISILLEPIKNDLGINDTEAGLLSGFAFGIVYTILGFPIARAADRYNRSWILAGCLAAWSGFTAVCGACQNFIQLALARAGVGIGEAGCTPTSHALIADYTPKEKRASALAFYAMGTPIGALLGSSIGGILADLFSWRVAFLVAAVPGLILAIVSVFTLKEPRTIIAAQSTRIQTQAATFRETLAYVSKKKAFWYLAFAAGVRALIGYGQGAFTASFFLRTHAADLTAFAGQFGMRPLTFIGLVGGIIGGTTGAFSSWLGGWIADKYGARDLRVFGSVPAIATLLSAPFSIFIFTTDNGPLAIFMGVIPALLGALWYGPVYSSAQGMVPQHMRATSASIMLFVINFLGLVLGAVVIGALSDVLNRGFHLGPAEGMRWALISSTLFGLISVWLFWAARGSIRDEMES